MMEEEMGEKTSFRLSLLQEGYTFHECGIIQEACLDRSLCLLNLQPYFAPLIDLFL